MFQWAVYSVGIWLSKELNVDCIEIHTGKISNLVKLKKNFKNELNRIKKSSILASKLNIEVHAGHGLDYKTTKILTKINTIQEFNIGHFIIGESIFLGLAKVIKNFKGIFKKVVTVKIPDEPSAVSSFDLCKIAKKNGFEATTSKSIKDALKKISTREKKIIVIFGSLYLVGHVLSMN